CPHWRGYCVSHNRNQCYGKSYASSEESVGDVRFRQFAKCMIQRNFRDVEGSEAVGFSHGQFGLVVETLDHAAGELLPGAEVVQDQRTVRAQRSGDLLHRLDAGPHDLTAPLIEELAGPTR